jgi:hypothetical protein
VKVAIIDKRHPTGRIVDEEIRKDIPGFLGRCQITTALDAGKVVRVTRSRFVDDTLRISCPDESSVEFLRKELASYKGRWEEVDLQMVDQKDIPRKRHVIGFFLTKGSDKGPQADLRRFKILNGGVGMRFSDWNTLYTSVQYRGTYFRVSVGEECIEALLRCNCSLYWSKRKIKIHTPGYIRDRYAERFQLPIPIQEIKQEP